MWKRNFRVFGKGLMDVLYPKRCAVCGKLLLTLTDVALCDKCLKTHHEIKCVRDDFFLFDEAVGAIKYIDRVKDSMLNYKFRGIRYYARAYAVLMDKAVNDRSYYRDAVMCSVPLSSGRKREYNQTALIARELSSMWGSEYIEELLYKCREVSPLSHMKLAERRFYIDGAIDANPDYDIYGKDILLIDDIFTSGTTATECTRALKMNGARRVYVLCACYD